MEQSDYNINGNIGNSDNTVKTVAEVEKLTLGIEGLRVLIEGIKALSVMKLLYQIQVTTDDGEREQLEMMLREMIVTVYQ